MGFHEVQFPTEITYGTEGGPGWKTEIVTTSSGHEHRVARWSVPRWVFNVGYAIKTHAALDTVRAFYLARRGAENGFRFRDPSDYRSSANGRDATANTDQTIGTGDGTTTQFQLVKLYQSGSQSFSRTIVKPVSGTVTVSLDDVDQGAAGGTWSVNTTTGVVTFNTAPGAGVVVKVGFDFDIPVRFSEEADTGLNVSYETFSSGSARNVSVVEILPDDAIVEDFPYRGSLVQDSMTADYTLSLLDGFACRFDPQSAGRKVVLPAVSTVPAGGIHFMIANQSSSHSLEIEEAVADGSGTVLNLGTMGECLLVVFKDSAGTQVWGALS